MMKVTQAPELLQLVSSLRQNSFHHDQLIILFILLILSDHWFFKLWRPKGW